MVRVKQRIEKNSGTSKERCLERRNEKVNIELEMNVKVSSNLEMTQTKHY